MSTKQAKTQSAVRHLRSSAPGLTARYIIGVLLTALGTACVLSLAAAGGSYVMTELRKYLAGVAGVGPLSVPLPFLLVWIGAALIVSCYHRVSFRTPLFALLLYICVLSLVTCVTRVNVQNAPYLMNYIPQYNERYYSTSFYSGSQLLGYGQRLFNWGYSGNAQGAGGTLSLVFAYPAYRLFGPVGGAVSVVVLGIAFLILLFGIRLTAIIRWWSDFLERQRQKRGQRTEPVRQQPPEPVASAIPQQQPVYNNPYTNVRWIYDETPAAPAQPMAQDFMRPGQEAPAYAQPAATGPFMPVNTQNELYQEPFVLHPDGAYDAMDDDLPPQAQDMTGPETDPAGEDPVGNPADPFRPPVRLEAADTGRPRDTDAPFMPAPARTEPVRPAAERPEPVQPAPEETETFEPDDIVPEVFEPVRPAEPRPAAASRKAEKPAERKPAARPAPDTQPPAADIPEEAPDTAPEEAGDDDDQLSEWQKKLRDVQRSLNRTRQNRRQLTAQPEPVHTDPVDLPKLDHVPVNPSAGRPSAGRPAAADALDNRPKMPDPPVKRVQNAPYTPPPMSFLALPKAVDPSESVLEDQRRAQQIERTLKTFNIDSQVREITHGPAITRFALKIAEGVKVKQVSGVLDNIMLEMGSDRIRIETPIPGTSYIGIEVPNSKVGAVTLREVLDSPEMRNAQGPLIVALGKDIAGTPIIGNLARMPHLLIAGATGSGKSVCINSIVCSLLYRATPKEVRLIMVDPKQVELQVYNGIPHLLIPVVCDPKKAAAALNWAVNEMMDRYVRFSKESVRSLEGFNKKMTNPDDRLPNIVIIIDEMADLMEVCRKDVEESIRRLAALARAAGIYMVLATQRPSVDVITGVVKNNIPSRIAFTVSSGTDSRTIIDSYGAEKLMGRGDMLYVPSGATKPLRVQGCFVSDDEVARITENIQARYQPDYNASMQDVLEKPPEDSGMSDDDAPEETTADVREKEYADLLKEAIRIAVHDGQTSISMLQRTLRIGYARAGRIIDEMTKRGIISTAEGSKPRKTIISREEYLQMMSDDLLGGAGEDTED